MLVHCVHLSSHGFPSPFTTTNNNTKSPTKNSHTGRQTTCLKLAGRHPFCFWLTWISVILAGLFTAVALSQERVNWKVCGYILFILGCIMAFIGVAIVHLRKFGQELRIELEGVILGQISRKDRNTRIIEPNSPLKETRKCSSVSFRADVLIGRGGGKDNHDDDDGSEVEMMEEESSFNCDIALDA